MCGLFNDVSMSYYTEHNKILAQAVHCVWTLVKK